MNDGEFEYPRNSCQKLPSYSHTLSQTLNLWYVYPTLTIKIKQLYSHRPIRWVSEYDTFLQVLWNKSTPIKCCFDWIHHSSHPISNSSSWWFQPIWKILCNQNGNLPQIGVKIKNIWVATTSSPSLLFKPPLRDRNGDYPMAQWHPGHPLRPVAPPSFLWSFDTFPAAFF